MPEEVKIAALRHVFMLGLSQGASFFVSLLMISDRIQSSAGIKMVLITL